MTVIVDNISDCGIKGEWGLCLLLETGGKKILVDTGGSSLFSENLKKLGFDIRDIDYGVLSHAHYDHANGMPKFFAENSKAKFYLREGSGHLKCNSTKNVKLFTDIFFAFSLLRFDYKMMA